MKLYNFAEEKNVCEGAVVARRKGATGDEQKQSHDRRRWSSRDGLCYQYFK